MISNRSRSKEWIMGMQKIAKGRDPILIEKMILALTLLESLRLSGLEFIFKGGTAVTLLLRRTGRFSIDIDLILPKQQSLDAVFRFVIGQRALYRYEESVRPGDLPKQHYKFFFHSVIQDQESHIMLDILYDENPYPRLTQADVSTPLLLIEGNATKVSCPTVECLLGDKLTAFAPHTTGIQYGKGKEMEIAKQLFDISELFDLASDIVLIRTTFERTATKELAYRRLPELTPRDVVLDSFQSARTIGARGSVRPREWVELIEGIKKLAAFVYSKNFTLDTALVCASKVAYLDGLILSKARNIGRFNANIDLSAWTITNPEYSKLNKLKKITPEGFFYFYQALRLIEQS
jgi:Nucleotidyl transferase AbiEii toxin, Type IV TA system